jgi:N-acetyl-gamma-glutamyl-phosphate reductase
MPEPPPAPRKRLGIVGARGHVGAELLAICGRHPALDIAYLGSRQLAGRQLGEVVPSAAPLAAGQLFEALEPVEVAEREADVVILALPNGLSAPFVAALEGSARGVAIVDVSADHRFDASWIYGLPEIARDELRGARRIANPGCYATAAQLALLPLAADLCASPRVFGVSGYSGAGTTPSPRNDPEALRDNLMPYHLVDHLHEREIGRGLGRRVHFLPHVAPFFRGITLTIDCELEHPMTSAELAERFRAHYAGEPLITISDDTPLVRDAVGRHGVTIGGFQGQGRRAVVVATIDNLLKGAATQAMQNVNLAIGFDELAGIAA